MNNFYVFMRIIFLGTSGAVPTKDRNHISIALIYEGEIILLDCGEGTQRQMVRAKISPMKVSKIFITHLHGDHFLGLFGLIQSMSFFGRESPLYIYGPKGIIRIVEIAKELSVYDIDFDLIPVEISDGFTVEEKNYKIITRLVDHSIETYSIIFEEKKGKKFDIEKAAALGLKPGPWFKALKEGKCIVYNGKLITPEMVLGEEKKGIRIVYTSDTRPTDRIANYIRDSILIHDATFDDNLRNEAYVKYHSTAKQAANVAKKYGAKYLFLIHVSSRYKDVTVLENEARNVFKNTYAAKDLMCIDIKKDNIIINYI